MSGPTVAMVDVLLAQVALDRKRSAYWMGRLDDLDATTSYLASLRDWLVGADDPYVTTEADA